MTLDEAAEEYIEVPLNRSAFISKFDKGFIEKFFGWGFCVTYAHQGAKQKYVLMRPKIGCFVPDGLVLKKYKAHRLVVSAQPGEVVDHINGDTLDNRASNLRIVTALSNARHRTFKRDDLTSKYFGVSKNDRGDWVAQINLKDKPKHVYRGKSEHEAAAARDIAVLESGCEFLSTNANREYLKYLISWAVKNDPRVLELVEALEAAEMFVRFSGENSDSVVDQEAALDRADKCVRALSKWKGTP